MHLSGFLFGLFHRASKEMRHGEQGAQSCGVWEQPCCPEHRIASQMSRSIVCHLLEMGRRACTSNFNLDVQLGIVNISFALHLSPRRVRNGWKLLRGALLMLLLLLMSITIAPRGPRRDQSFLAHHPPAHWRSTGYSCLAKEKIGCR